jgi:hypothetical protein
MSAIVFWLNDAVFNALLILVLKAAISLQPLANTLEPVSERINTVATSFFIIVLQDFR